MKFKKLLIIWLHIILLLSCLAMVLLMGWIAGGRHEEIHTAVIKETKGEGEEPDTVGEEELTQESEEPTGDENSLTEKDRTEKEQKKKERQETEAPSEEEEPYIPPTLMLASDLHYMSRTTHDDGAAFQAMMGNDDGKVSRYSDEIVDGLLEEAIRLKPSALLLTGDITLNGERENHEMLAQKLNRVQESGVQVLVIPGNHDIGNQSAATYFGSERKETVYLESGQEFYEIYHAFGYDQALNRDEESLSYLYALDETHWLLLLDSCRYEDRCHVSGRIHQGTLHWMEEQLKTAKQQGVQVTVAAHHNLLSESRLYTTECTLENAAEVVQLLEAYEAPLYISGHLHAQRIKKHLSEPGADPESCSIWEIVLSPYSLPPCQYGVLAWSEADDMIFDTRTVPVADYAREQGSEDTFLLEFDQKGPEFLKNVISSQVMNSIYSVPDDLKRQMADLYADLYFDYCAGNRISRQEIRAEKAYRLWERAEPDNRYMAEMGQMMEDVRSAMHDWKNKIEKGENDGSSCFGE